jgi:hypothetical protein
MLVSYPTWALHRADMWAAILTVTSQSEVNRVQSGDSTTMVAALLGAANWGGASGLVSTLHYIIIVRYS